MQNDSTTTQAAVLRATAGYLEALDLPVRPYVTVSDARPALSWYLHHNRRLPVGYDQPNIADVVMRAVGIDHDWTTRRYPDQDGTELLSRETVAIHDGVRVRVDVVTVDHLRLAAIAEGREQVPA